MTTVSLITSKHFAPKWTILPSQNNRQSTAFIHSNSTSLTTSMTANIKNTSTKSNGRHRTPRQTSKTRCGARRRAIRYDEDDEQEEYGHNEEITMLEAYSQSARHEVLLVRALLDDEELQVLIFKGFSSSLSHRTSPDPSRSVLPARAVIRSIDRIKGPFDPSNIEFIEQDIDWSVFKNRLEPS